MKFGYCLTVAGSGCLECFLESHSVCARRVFFYAESAEAAGGNANIRWVDVSVDIEISLVPVHALADVISQPADRKNIASAVQRNSVIEVETRAGHDFLMD
jgi:hypothetical protein